jgi:hypothetical protein
MMREKEDMPFAGYRPVGRVEVFVFTKGRFHQRADGNYSRVPKPGPASNLRKWETTSRMRKGVTLTSDSASAHLARKVASVEAGSIQIFGLFARHKLRNLH